MAYPLDLCLYYIYRNDTTIYAVNQVEALPLSKIVSWHNIVTFINSKSFSKLSPLLHSFHSCPHDSCLSTHCSLLPGFPDSSLTPHHTSSVLVQDWSWWEYPSDLTPYLKTLLPVGLTPWSSASHMKPFRTWIQSSFPAGVLLISCHSLLRSALLLQTSLHLFFF